MLAIYYFKNKQIWKQIVFFVERRHGRLLKINEQVLCIFLLLLFWWSHSFAQPSLKTIRPGKLQTTGKPSYKYGPTQTGVQFLKNAYFSAPYL
jgi:hypothetical protein